MAVVVIVTVVIIFFRGNVILVAVITLGLLALGGVAAPHASWRCLRHLLRDRWADAVNDVQVRDLPRE